MADLVVLFGQSNARNHGPPNFRWLRARLSALKGTGKEFRADRKWIRSQLGAHDRWVRQPYCRSEPSDAEFRFIASTRAEGGAWLSDWKFD